MIRNLARRWLLLGALTGTALVVWALAAAHGYGWSTVWVPAVVAGATWPRTAATSFSHCRKAAADWLRRK